MTVRDALQGVLDAWQSGDALRAGAYFSAEAVYREAGRTAIEGRAAIVAHFTRFFRDGPGFAFAPQEMIINGERAVVVYTFELKGKPQIVKHEGCAIVHFVDGLIAVWREYEG